MGQMRGSVVEGGDDSDGAAGEIVVPVEAPPKLELGDGPKTLGAPSTFGAGVIGLGGAGEIVVPVEAPPKLEPGEDPNRLGGVPVALGAMGLVGAPKMLGGVPIIGAAPLEGLPTLPIELPGVLEMAGAVPMAGAPPGGTEPWAKVLAGSANSAADKAGAANVLCNMRISCLPSRAIHARGVPAARCIAQRKPLKPSGLVPNFIAAFKRNADGSWSCIRTSR
jgi:hypothetical protein